MQNRFGALMKHWRSIRRCSQLDLSNLADISARHISFLESGRANPSRSMVLRLCNALSVPRAEANEALLTAGFAPVFPTLDIDAPALAPVHQAIELMLANHNPFPAFAIDRYWSVTTANDSASALLASSGAQMPLNLIKLLMDSAALDLFENWDEVAILTLARLRSEVAHLGGDQKLAEMAEQLASVPRLAQADRDAIRLDRAVIPTVINIHGQRLSLFSTIAHFGTVQDTQAGEIRIELMFPMDDETGAFFSGQHSPGTAS